MEVDRLRALRGPNLWTRTTAMEAMVTLGDGEHPGQTDPDEDHRVLDLLALLEGSNGMTRPPATRAHAYARVALALQVRAGCPVTYHRVVTAVEGGAYKAVVEYSEEAVGRKAMVAAEALIHAAVEDRASDVTGNVAALKTLDEEIRLGPSTGSIVRAARERGVPIRRLTDGSMVRLGWGARQRLILAAETDRTPAVAESIAQDKHLTKELLAAAGVPVPAGRPVEDAEDAWAAAREVGLPVVVKPQDGSQGRGVAVNLTTRERVLEAYAAAAAVSPDVMVERFVQGRDYRLLVVGDRLVAAACREPPQVIGDGIRTIRALVEKANADPRRSDGHATSLSRIRLDDIAQAVLGGQGLTTDSVPAPGARVVLRGNANLSTGGSATDVTDEVHPDVATRAVEAAKVVGLDICGVDVVAPRVDRPMEETGGAVVEVNAAPGLRMHLDPSYGQGRPVGQAIVATLFAPGDDGRVPLVAVSGTNGKTTTVRMVAHLLSCLGRTVGMACSDGVYIGGERIDSGDCSGPRSARNVLSHPDVEAAVLETARGGILREGLGFDRCDVAVVTNVGTGDHLGLAYIDTVEDLAVVKRVIVQAVAPHGTAVLNAEDPLVARMADACRGSVLFFASDPENPVLAAHKAKGGRVVYREGDFIVAACGTDRVRMPLEGIPLTHGGRIPFQVENTMAALGAGWALGLPWDALRTGLCTFVNDPRTAPGRFNVLSHRGATVVADYGHNPDAITALVAAVERLATGRRVVVISAAGDRRDSDIVRQGEILGDAFDEVVLYQDRCQRGRADGEVVDLLRRGLAHAKRAAVVDEIRGESAAIDRCLAVLKPGDLALILIDQVDESLDYLARTLQPGA
jgi:cyanophycin synthetase